MQRPYDRGGVPSGPACPACRGSGKVRVEGKESGTETTTITVLDCPVCAGTGKQAGYKMKGP